jgi:hypothetical protein
MRTQKLEVIAGSLESARTWESKGTDSWRNIAWSNKSVSSALMNLLSIAVEDFSNHSDASTWLLENGALPLLRKAHEQIERLIAEVDAGRIPPSTYGGNYPHLVYAHVSWAVGDFSLGESFVAISERDENAKISTPFWCSYAKAMGALVHNVPYQTPKMKLRGQEEYWIAYLYLIEDISNGRSGAKALQGIEHGFTERNSDIRINDDAYEIEGSGYHPVRWDFRRDSLIAYIGRQSA